MSSRKINRWSAAAALFCFMAPAVVAQRAPLRVDDVLRTALETSPQVRAAQARVDAARGASMTAATLPNPLLTYQVENSRFPGQRTLPGLDAERSLFATIPLEPIYQRGPRMRRAEEDVHAAEAELAATRWSVALDALRTLDRLALAQLTVNSVTDVRKGLDELVAYNEQRVKEGVAAEGDLIRVKIERDRAAIEESVARAETARAAAELRRLTGQSASEASVGSAMTPAADVVSSGTAPPIPSFDDVLARARAQQPELAAARARSAAARAEVEVQRAFSVRQLGATFGNKRIGKENSMIAGLTVPLPFFDRNRGEIARAASERLAAEEEEEWTERAVVARLEGAYEATRLLSEQARGMERDLVSRAEESRTIALAAYREGAGSLLQVLDASRALGEVRLTWARLLLAQRESRLELDAAAGGEPLQSLDIIGGRK